MLTEKQKESSKNFGYLLFILFTIFLILQLTGLITWSWWWVTVPLWGLFALFFGIFIIGANLIIIYYFIREIIYVPIINVIDKRHEKKIGLEIIE